jgi:hypothetical protein
MSALNVNYRPGVVMWYYNGEYLWSQNEPAETGPGRGFLLVVDANPQEFTISALPQQYFQSSDGWTSWQFDDTAQPWLRDSFVDAMCFQRRPDYYSTDVSQADTARCAEVLMDGQPAMERLSWDGRPLMYGYSIINEFLPGPERRARKSGGTLFDLRIRDGQTQYRLYDRALRGMHSADAPFATADFANGLEIYRAEDGVMRRQTATPFTAVSTFTDERPNRYQNPRLPFGGADIPDAGFSYTLEPPDAGAPEQTEIRLNFRWR